MNKIESWNSPLILTPYSYPDTPLLRTLHRSNSKRETGLYQHNFHHFIRNSVMTLEFLFTVLTVTRDFCSLLDHPWMRWLMEPLIVDSSKVFYRWLTVSLWPVKTRLCWLRWVLGCLVIEWGWCLVLMGSYFVSGLSAELNLGYQWLTVHWHWSAKSNCAVVGIL